MTDASETEINDVNIIGSKDWFLQSTIETIINSGVEMGITLIVGGTIVSGTLIDGRKFFIELGDALTADSKSAGDSYETLGTGWKEFAALYDKPENAPEDWSPPSAGFIHLRDARYHAPGQNPLPTHKGVLWRGKLSSVDGFNIGSLSAG